MRTLAVLQARSELQCELYSEGCSCEKFRRPENGHLQSSGSGETEENNGDQAHEKHG